MSATLPTNSATAGESFRIEPHDDAGLWPVIQRGLAPFASLKVTVVLFALSIGLVFLGTLAQVDKDIWQVIREYFRCFVAIVPLKVLTPPSFFPNGPHIPDWVRIPYPGGWTLGIGLFVNLLAAHISRFTIQAKAGERLWGSLLMLAGIVVTWFVIDSGSSVGGIVTHDARLWDILWSVLMLTLGAAFLGSVYGVFQMRSDQKIERWGLVAVALTLGGTLGYLLTKGSGWRPDDAGMRILWQLVKGTLAGVVLLVGCWALFRKRAGIVLLHGGIGLMMFNELYVGVTNVEGQMQIEEGQTVNFARDIRSVELAVIDRSGKEDRVVAVPEARLTAAAKDESVIQADKLPFDLKVVRWIQNSNLEQVSDDQKTPATDGQGKYWFPEEVRPGSGTDKESRVDISSAYVELLKKGTTDSLGVRLVNVEFSERNEPERVAVDGKEYDLFLRFRRDYKPYEITLRDVKKEDYIGTSTPRDYRSIIHLVDAGRGVDRDDIPIWMNNPLRFGGETFYQSGYNKVQKIGLDPATGRKIPKVVEMTTLAVVSNTQWMIPYVGCMIVLVGMLAQFLITLIRFLRRQDESPAWKTAGETEAEAAAEANAAADARGGHKEDHRPTKRHKAARRAASAPAVDYGLAGIIFPVALVLVCGLYVLSKAKPSKPARGEFDYVAFGRLPVVEQGRVKPFDTLARNMLSILTAGRQEYVDENDKKQPAMKWLLDVIADPKAADKHKVFRIDNLEVLEILGLERRKNHYYSVEEMAPRIVEFSKQVDQARKLDALERDVAQRKLLELANRMQTYRLLTISFQPPPLPPLPDPEMIKTRPDEAKRMFVDFRSELADVEQRLGEMHAPLAVSTQLSEDDTTLRGGKPPAWETYAVAWGHAYMQQKIMNANPPAGVGALNKALGYYARKDVAEFNEAVADYHTLLDTTRVKDLDVKKVRFEAFFNRFSPFFYASWLNVLAFALAAGAWLGWSVPLNRAAFWLIVLNLVVHTFGLCARMYISGRPPVTNLYSSAVFIGWGAVILGLVLEVVFRLGVGNVIASVSGFSTLLIAHMLSGDGDTFTVLQAVLDTQFWLATHVTCITFGYATTFVAGLLGILYIVLGVATPRLTKETGRDLTRMIYGTLCFATFFSFVGTVLGGLWADDSWGRFWGWDPKENGALIIVLWNALVLHARWGGMVKERGLAALAVVGNIVTAWSWFGVNELGVGLHSYGFTEGVLLALGLFVLSQLVVVAAGCLPRPLWISTIAAGGERNVGDVA